MKHNNLQKGVWKAVCAVCGFVYNSNELRLRWDGKYVCDKDYEPRNILDFFKVKEEKLSVPWTQVESLTYTNYVSIDDTDSPYTATVDIDQIDVDATNGNVVINLPLASTYTFARSKLIKIRRLDDSVNTVTIQTQGSDKVNGATSETLAINGSVAYNNDAVLYWNTF